MQIHRGKVLALVTIDRGIIVDTNIEEGTQFFCLLQCFNMSHMKQVECSINIDDLIFGFRCTMVAELGQSPGGRQEVGDTG